MTSLNFHPEHLLDGFIRGKLDDAERAQLEAHLSQCEACRLEVGIGTALSVNSGGESLGALTSHDAPTDSVIEGALSQMVADQTLRSPALHALRVTRIRGRRTLGRRVLLAGLLFSLGAAAAVLVMKQLEGEDPGRSEGPATPAQVASASKKAARHRVEKNEPHKEPLENSLDDDQGSTEPATQSGPTQPAPAPLPDVHPKPQSAAQLFAQATQLRRAKDNAQATARYQELQRAYPGSPEALVSRLALGQLLLATQPNRALAQFDGYLKRGGPLRIEALVGKAQALGRLGQVPSARAIWEEILESAPDSIYAEQARRHLAPSPP